MQHTASWPFATCMGGHISAAPDLRSDRLSDRLSEAPTLSSLMIRFHALWAVSHVRIFPTSAWMRSRASSWRHKSASVVLLLILLSAASWPKTDSHSLTTCFLTLYLGPT